MQLLHKCKNKRCVSEKIKEIKEIMIERSSVLVSYR